MRKNWIILYSQLWELRCPSKGSAEHDGQRREGGWAADEKCGSRREEHGEDVLSQLYCWAAAPFPAQTREQQQPGAGIALGADPSVPQTPVCWVLARRVVQPGSQSALSQEPEKNPESLPIIYV